MSTGLYAEGEENAGCCQSVLGGYTYRDLGHALVDDIHSIETVQAVDGCELEQGELNELRSCDECPGLHDEENDTAVAVVALDTHDSLGASRDIPITSPSASDPQAKKESLTGKKGPYQIREAIAAVTRMFVAMDKTYIAVPHFTIVGGLGCGRSH